MHNIHDFAPGPEGDGVVFHCRLVELRVHLHAVGQSEVLASLGVELAAEAAPALAVGATPVEAVVAHLALDGKEGEGVLAKLRIAETDGPRLVATLVPVVQHLPAVAPSPAVEGASPPPMVVPPGQLPIHPLPAVGPCGPAPRTAAHAEVGIFLIGGRHAHLVAVAADGEHPLVARIAVERLIHESEEVGTYHQVVLHDDGASMLLDDLRHAADDGGSEPLVRRREGAGEGAEALDVFCILPNGLHLCRFSLFMGAGAIDEDIEVALLRLLVGSQGLYGSLK